jgi:Hint domain
MTAQPLGQVMGDVHPVAHLMTGMARGTVVLTLDGAMPVEFLVPGDRIITRDGARLLRAVDVAEVTGSVVRIGARTLGHDRPEGDVVVGVDQGILLRDWRAKAMYGASQAVVAARRMADGEMIRVEDATDLRLFTLSFDTPAVIYAGGLELACAAVTVDA